jgi:hypothetical protein
MFKPLFHKGAKTCEEHTEKVRKNSLSDFFKKKTPLIALCVASMLISPRQAYSQSVEDNEKERSEILLPLKDSPPGRKGRLDVLFRFKQPPPVEEFKKRIVVEEATPDVYIPTVMTKKDVEKALERASRFQIPPDKFETHRYGDYRFSGLKLTGTTFILAADSLGTFGIFNGSVPLVVNWNHEKSIIINEQRNVLPPNSNISDEPQKQTFVPLFVISTDNHTKSPSFDYFKYQMFGDNYVIRIGWGAALWRITEAPFISYPSLPRLYKMFYRSEITGNDRLLLIVAHANGGVFVLGFETDDKPSLVHFVGVDPDAIIGENNVGYDIGIITEKENGLDKISVLLLPAKNVQHKFLTDDNVYISIKHDGYITSILPTRGETKVRFLDIAE